jgi:protein-disulfide isomerase
MTGIRLSYAPIIYGGNTLKYLTYGAVIASVLSVASILVPSGVVAETPVVNSDIEELKKGQAEIKKELAEIRKLLTPAPAPSAVEKLEATVALGSIAPRGNKNAPVTMIEFSDYQCPYCKRHADQTVPALIKEYVDTGKLRYAFRDLPLTQIHPLAAKAAEAARCAGDQGKYWEMHDRLFANQKELQAEKLPAHAKAIGLDEAAFRACLDDSRHAAAVKKDLDAGTELGINGTPAIIIGINDGEQVKNAVVIRGAHPIATFKAEIERLLAAPTAATE